MRRHGRVERSTGQARDRVSRGVFVAVAAAVALSGAPIPGVGPLRAAAAAAAPPPPLPPVSAADARRQAAVVDTEDIRLRSTFARFGMLTRPTVVRTQGSLPTVLIPGRPRPYTAADLVEAGALRRQVDGAYLPVSSVVVGPGPASSSTVV